VKPHKFFVFLLVLLGLRRLLFYSTIAPATRADRIVTPISHREFEDHGVSRSYM